MKIGNDDRFFHTKNEGRMRETIVINKNNRKRDNKKKNNRKREG